MNEIEVMNLQKTFSIFDCWGVVLLIERIQHLRRYGCEVAEVSLVFTKYPQTERPLVSGVDNTSQTTIVLGGKGKPSPLEELSQLANRLGRLPTENRKTFDKACGMVSIEMDWTVH